jgi:hypothetical protein
MIHKIHPSALLLPLPLFLMLCAPVHAAAIDETLPDAQTLSQLETRAQLADPREQCFLYTELIHTMTEIAGRQMRDGNVDEASIMLTRINHYAQLIHMELAGNSKRLKNTEMLMHHTTYKLGEYLRRASAEDRLTLQATLNRLDQVHNEILTQVFKH